MDYLDVTVQIPFDKEQMLANQHLDKESISLNKEGIHQINMKAISRIDTFNKRFKTPTHSNEHNDVISEAIKLGILSIRTESEDPYF